jgi:hypothetical protein
VGNFKTHESIVRDLATRAQVPTLLIKAFSAPLTGFIYKKP